jgi:plastocyanin
MTALLASCEIYEPEPQGYGGAAGNDQDSAPVTVEMTYYHAFRPGTVTVRVGDTVVWKNASRETHTATADAALVKTSQGKDWVKIPDGAIPFHSGDLGPTDSFSHTFTIAGTYQYVCLIHEVHAMFGTVVVKPKEATP